MNKDSWITREYKEKKMEEDWLVIKTLLAAVLIGLCLWAMTVLVLCL